MRRAPAFWWRSRPIVAARVLAPLGALYGALTSARMARPGRRLDRPVICVGNLVVGGAGKTPTVVALVDLLRALGERPAILSRGYGRTNAKTHPVLLVDPLRHGFTQVGDEPLLLAAAAPTYVSADRVAAGRRAIAAGATVLLLDDGLQSPQLAKTGTIAVVDGATGIGNGLCLPAGPLRAPLARQWPYVTAVCIIGAGRPGEQAAIAARERKLPVWRARLVPDVAAIGRLRYTPLHAFAAIGRPDKFFGTLRDAGLDVVAVRAFPDHHPFTPGDLRRLRADATRQGARLVTTTKDAVRLPSGFPAVALPVTLRFDMPDAVSSWLRSTIVETAVADRLPDVGTFSG